MHLGPKPSAFTCVYIYGAFINYLKKKLDTLDGGDGGLGDGSSSTTRGKIDQEFSSIETLLF